MRQITAGKTNDGYWYRPKKSNRLNISIWKQSSAKAPAQIP
jgi:hypothetical protein